MSGLVGRKFTALLLVLALFVAMVPMTAAASGNSSSMPPAMIKTMSMPCDQNAPAQNQQMPCNGCGCCLGMLGCVAPVTPPQLVVAPVEFRLDKASRSTERDPGGISAQPAYRPPII
jgi:hypothetical protein